MEGVAHRLGPTLSKPRPFVGIQCGDLAFDVVERGKERQGLPRNLADVSAYSLSGHDTPKRLGQTQDWLTGRSLRNSPKRARCTVVAPRKWSTSDFATVQADGLLRAYEVKLQGFEGDEGYWAKIERTQGLSALTVTESDCLAGLVVHRYLDPYRNFLQGKYKKLYRLAIPRIFHISRCPVR